MITNMVISCSAYGCTNRNKKESGTYTFPSVSAIYFAINFKTKLKISRLLIINKIYLNFRFPLKRPEIFKKWIQEMKRKSFTPNQYSYLCSEPFIPSDYLNKFRPELNKKLLKDEAVPSVFIFAKKQLVNHSLVEKRQMVSLFKKKLTFFKEYQHYYSVLLLILCIILIIKMYIILNCNYLITYRL